MAENSAIEWTDHTFNPWIGCTKVGPGCDHCYAETLSRARLGVEWGLGKPRRRTKDWAKPLRWNRAAAAFAEANGGRKQRVFCASLADVFDNEVDPAWRRDLFDLIAATPNLDWLLVTKRIGNVTKMLENIGIGHLPAHVWLGITVVNQTEADRDIPKLRAAPATIRFLSVEPMQGAIDLDELLYLPCPNSLDGLPMDPSTGAYECCSRCDWTGISCEPALDWVICGGESGSGARPIHPDWARTLRDQCDAAQVPFLFKQWGEWAPSENCTIDCTAEALIYDATAKEWRKSIDGGWIGDQAMCRVGKKRAGRLLDGVEHNGFPNTSGNGVGR